MRLKRWAAISLAVFICVLGHDAKALDNVPGVCVDNCGGGSSSGGSSGGWGGGSDDYDYTPPTPRETREQQMYRLNRSGDERWENRAPGRRQNQSRQMQPFRELNREANSLRQKTAEPGNVPDKNTAILGIKSGAGETGVKKAGRDKDPRILKTEWERVSCASQIAASVMEEYGKGEAADLDHMGYLADEALNALVKGMTQGIGCSPSSAPGMYGQSLQTKKEALKAVIEDTAAQIQNVDRAQGALLTLKMTETETSGKLNEIKREEKKQATPAKSPKNTKDEVPSLASIWAEQQKTQKEYQDSINRVFQEQKKKESAREEYLAALREFQKAINEENSRKKEATEKLKANMDRLGQIVGNR